VFFRRRHIVDVLEAGASRATAETNGNNRKKMYPRSLNQQKSSNDRSVRSMIRYKLGALEVLGCNKKCGGERGPSA
jgi:hypothetical protein